jgi:hypothetical protein
MNLVNRRRTIYGIDFVIRKMTTPHVTDRIRRKNGELTGFSTAGTGLLLTGLVILSLPNRANK